jgi:hypothetical protein
MLSHVPDLDRRVDLAREILSTRQDDIDFESEPALASEIAALGLWREIGTANDQLTTRLIDADSGASVPVECARSELIDHRGNVGIRIWYDRHERLDVPSYFLRALFHPDLSFNPDGTLHQIVIFPITVARIARLEDAKLVIVPRWALDMPFAHPDSETWQYYRDFGKPERWAAVRDWVLHFCELTIDKKIPFFTTHDLSAHITGVQKAAWDMLGVVARKLKDCMDHVFAGCPDPPTQTLILPFMAGYLLDGLAQPVHGDNERMLIVIDSLLEAIAEPAIDPRAPGILRRFPQSYWKVLDHMRLAPVPPPASYRDEIRELIRDVVVEIKHEVHAA